MKEFVGKRVRVIFDSGRGGDGIPKDGTLISVNDTFVLLETSLGREALPVSRIIRCIEVK